MNPHVVHNIKIIRGLYNLKQEDFAKKFSNVSRAMQQSYETAKAEPSNLYMAQLAKLAGLTVDELTTMMVSPDKVKIEKSVENTEETEDSFPSDQASDMYQSPNSSEPGVKGAQTTGKPQPTQNDLQKAVIDQAATIRMLTEILHSRLGTA